MSKISEKKRRALFVAAIIFAVTGVVYEFALSGRISSPPDSEMIDSVITRLAGGIAIACLLPVFGYKVFAKPTAFSVLSVLPCYAAVVCNPPLIGLMLGDAEIIYGEGYRFVLFAAECLATGFFEELLFRAILFPAILEKRRQNSVKIFLSVIVSSAIFALVHLLNLFAGAGFGPTVMQIGYSFLIGALCAFVLIKTGNIAFCVFLHATFNFTGTLVERLGTGGWGGLPTVFITLAVALPVAVYVIYSLIKIPIETTDKLFKSPTDSHE